VPGEFVSVPQTIGTAGDRDFFAIDALAGDWYVAWADRPGVEQDGTAGGGTPDTVIKLYNEQGAVIATNDDMPYRAQNTDAGMVWQAKENGRVYVEVIEWADWAGESPSGGPSYQYDMRIWQGDFGEVATSNDTILDSFGYSDANGNDFQQLSIGWSDVERTSFFSGFIDTTTDVDVFELGTDDFSLDSPDDPLLCQFGGWPDQPTELNPKLDVFWENCTPGAEDDGDCDGQGDDIILVGSYEGDLSLTPPGANLPEDSAVQAAIVGGRYYVQVSDANGEGGAGYSYTVLYSCYGMDNWVREIETNSTDPGQSTFAELTQSANEDFPNFYFGRIHGDFRATEGEGSDVFDTWAVVDQLDDEDFVNVEIEAGEAGSLAGEITLKLWRNEGGGVYTELASDTGTDPSIVNYQIGPDDITLAVTLEVDGSVQGYGTQYFGFISVDDKASE